MEEQINEFLPAKEGNTRKRQRTLKNYVSKTLRGSLVTGVSSIVSTDNVRRKIFKLSVLLLCIAGFTYQIVVFLKVVLDHPSVVDISVSKRTSVISPAFTFCNYNGIKRSKFCAQYPDRCMALKDNLDICRMYPKYFFCKRKDISGIMVPREKYWTSEKNLSREDLLTLGHDSESMIVDMYQIVKQNIMGPILRDKDGMDGRFGCYSVYSRINDSIDPVMVEIDFGLIHLPIFEISFNAEEDETFHPDAKPGVLFCIHSPFEVVNPYSVGTMLKPGWTYKIQVRLEEEQLLPSPYHTDCINYTAEWEKNNRKGPRSQDICSQKCFLEFSLKCCNCVFPLIALYPTQEDMCSLEMTRKTCNMSEERLEELAFCLGKCKDDCSKTKFSYKIEERYVPKIRKVDEAENHVIQVEVSMAEIEVIRLKFRPQYEFVEIFSNIGGFMGIWLGISLVAIVDFFESIFCITRFYLKKRTSENLSSQLST